MGPSQSGTTSAGLVAGGFYPPGINVSQATEEWTGPSDNVITFDATDV